MRVWVLAFGIAEQKGIGTRYSWSATEHRPALEQVKAGASATGRTEAVNEMAKVVGRELMTRYLIAFEVAGLLLTAAIVGAIAIAHREEIDPSAARSAPRSAAETGARQTARARRPIAVAAAATEPH